MVIENIPAFMRAVGFALLLFIVLLALLFVEKYRFLFFAVLLWCACVVLYIFVRQAGDNVTAQRIQDLGVTTAELWLVLTSGFALYRYLKNGGKKNGATPTTRPEH